MKIFLIRHGQTTGDIEDRFGGDYNDDLTEHGRCQAEELAGKIKDSRIEKIFYSPLKRATQTAQIVHQKLGVNIEMIKDLRERNAYGILTGQLKSEAKEKYPDMIEQLKNSKATIEGAEPYEEFKLRVASVFKEITDREFGTIGIITHGGVISCFLREVIGRERKSLADCAIIELDFENDQYEIVKSDGLELE